MLERSIYVTSVKIDVFQTFSSESKELPQLKMNSKFTHLNIQNISELGTDVIEEFFYGISVKDVLELSLTNTRFSEACKRESFWKKKVLLDYGVKKKFGETWKKTAMLLSNSNMINLGKEWIDGQTYGELLEEATKGDNELFVRFFKEILTKYRIPRSQVFVYSQSVEDLKSAEIDYCLSLHPDNTIARLKAINIGPTDEDTLQHVLRVVTREFSVIMHAVSEAKRYYSLFSSGQEWEEEIDQLQDKELKTSKEIKSLVDPIPYVMMYSLQTVKTLNIMRL
uniref:F-box domain-containing protein n=1 Tax=Pithovirus LCPAC403 TaxID=2506596 RepID=A0A481ZDP1_9VIRU|nr:MAG: hypothetical protein LCPAC403_04040 [Pithovirus LCPAC403]